MNQDGKRTLLSFFHFGVGDADKELARTIDGLEESNRLALKIWSGRPEDDDSDGSRSSALCPANRQKPA
jgi:hypothetical protein